MIKWLWYKWSSTPVWRREDTLKIAEYLFMIFTTILMLSAIVMDVAFGFQHILPQGLLVMGNITVVILILIRVWDDTLIWLPENEFDESDTLMGYWEQMYPFARENLISHLEYTLMTLAFSPMIMGLIVSSVFQWKTMTPKILLFIGIFVGALCLILKLFESRLIWYPYTSHDDYR